MAFKTFLTAGMAASSLLASSAFAFDANSKTNLAVYYGQGPYQQRLAHFCQQTSMDIIPIGFIHIFPDQGKGGYPGSNFGNQCSSDVYLNEDGVPTQLLKDCHQIAEDIPICQAAGKKILLSLGGATPDYKLKNQRSARDFADFLWGAFGPKTVQWGNKPRPFGDVVVDGFDFDIEHNGDNGYVTMVDRLRYRFKEDSKRKYYISAAPQCPPDDAQLAVPIVNSYFDFIFVQFYNTLWCSARSYVSNPRTSDFSFDDWVKVIKRSPNPAARLYIGLLGNKNATTVSDIYYLTPEEVKPLARTFMNKHPNNFGGIMIWEATYSENNQINGKSYADHMKRILYELSPPPPTTTSTSTSTSSAPTTSSYPASSSEAPYPTETVDPTDTATVYPTDTATVDPT
ncbi:chitinase, partial [Blastomyces parvus]